MSDVEARNPDCKVTRRLPGRPEPNCAYNQMRILFDPAKNDRNIRERGLSFESVAGFDFNSALVWADQRRAYARAHYAANKEKLAAARREKALSKSDAPSCQRSDNSRWRDNDV